MRRVIRLNDPTTDGGKVVAVAPNTTAMGVAAGRKGDCCFCPMKGHAVCVIAESDPHGQSAAAVSVEAA